MCAATTSTTQTTSKRIFQLETSRFHWRIQPGKLSAYVMNEYTLVRQASFSSDPLGFVKKKYQVLRAHYSFWFTSSGSRPTKGTITFNNQAGDFGTGVLELLKTLQLSPTNANSDHLDARISLLLHLWTYKNWMLLF